MNGAHVLAMALSGILATLTVLLVVPPMRVPTRYFAVSLLGSAVANTSAWMFTCATELQQSPGLFATIFGAVLLFHVTVALYIALAFAEYFPVNYGIATYWVYCLMLGLGIAGVVWLVRDDGLIDKVEVEAIAKRHLEQLNGGRPMSAEFTARLDGNEWRVMVQSFTYEDMPDGTKRPIPVPATGHVIVSPTGHVLGIEQGE